LKKYFQNDGFKKKKKKRNKERPKRPKKPKEREEVKETSLSFDFGLDLEAKEREGLGFSAKSIRRSG